MAILLVLAPRSSIARFILGDPGADSGGEGKSKRAGKYGTKKSKERREEPLGTMSYQTSSKRSPLFWLLIGARKTNVFETSVTVINNSPIEDYVHTDDQTQPTFEI